MTEELKRPLLFRERESIETCLDFPNAAELYLYMCSDNTRIESDHLWFLNAILESYAKIVDNLSKPLSVVNYLNGLSVNEPERLIITSLMQKMVSGYRHPSGSLVENRIKACLNLINAEREKMIDNLSENLSIADDEFWSLISDLSEPADFDSQFKISDKKGAQTDMVRILNAMYHLNLVKNEEGDFPSKTEFMEGFNRFFGGQLKNWSRLLDQSKNKTSVGKPVEVFQKMIDITNGVKSSTK